jgi:hypothetical protein
VGCERRPWHNIPANNSEVVSIMKLFRRRRLPAGRRPPMEPDERIVAWAGAADDEVVVVTNRGIWLPLPAGRLGWHEIHKATWSGRQLALVASREVGAGDGYTIVADQPAIVHTLLDPDNVPLQVRVRVTRSIAYTQMHPLPDGGAVRVVARRVPGLDGLTWTVRYEEGADPTDDRIRAVTDDVVAYGKASVEGAGP